MKNLEKGVLFSSLTTLEIGGPIKYLYRAQTQPDLIKIIKYAQSENIPYLVIGGGSNLLVSDSGVDLLVIRDEVSGIEEKNGNIVVQGGTSLQELVDYTISHSLSGAHKLTGIPGTVAGAIFGNAGAYGQTISDYLTKVICFDGKKKSSLIKKSCGFSYRDSDFKKNGLIILEAHFQFPIGNSVDLAKDSQEVLKKRLTKYKPGIKCPGSFFKNVLMEDIPQNTKKLIPQDRDYFGKVPAWYFLDSVGAKGAKKGNIEVASFHGNLFINLGQGSAEDFYYLAKKLHTKVKKKFGISLEPEVRLVNLPLLD